MTCKLLRLKNYARVVILNINLKSFWRYRDNAVDTWHTVLERFYGSITVLIFSTYNSVTITGRMLPQSLCHVTSADSFLIDTLASSTSEVENDSFTINSLCSLIRWRRRAIGWANTFPHPSSVQQTFVRASFESSTFSGQMTFTLASIHLTTCNIDDNVSRRRFIDPQWSDRWCWFLHFLQ